MSPAGDLHHWPGPAGLPVRRALRLALLRGAFVALPVGFLEACRGALTLRALGPGLLLGALGGLLAGAGLLPATWIELRSASESLQPPRQRRAARGAGLAAGLGLVAAELQFRYSVAALVGGGPVAGLAAVDAALGGRALLWIALLGWIATVAVAAVTYGRLELLTSGHAFRSDRSCGCLLLGCLPLGAVAPFVLLDRPSNPERAATALAFAAGGLPLLVACFGGLVVAYAFADELETWLGRRFPGGEGPAE